MLSKLLLVGAGGFIGAILRYGISQWINKRTASALPVATLFVNILGSFVLGLITGLDLSTLWVLFAGTGILGAFTTFSTFKLESVQLHFKKNWKTFVLYTVLSYTLGIALAWSGFHLGKLF
ncbi:fluoride efflux transporter CrcB [Halobacillus sp. Nhm2S1]|uniref:fluoride efflux transporter CrcB n=1 Tax=Halobacillus sp. Nhm2S1 TaxID=2866716 RepID=UPI001C7355ED|nr:fluoride efflux transporter CrcB [Halobacillus sp. Nhm2S1]MBX0358420.1 fluoride efflux transporter CrcB [Halobacillus sp. Nhm2S1]